MKDTLKHIDQTGLDKAEDEDSLLMTRVRLGDRNAYRGLVERYQAKAFAIALGVVGNNESAEDVVQEAFLRAYCRLRYFRGESSFYTWLYRIVYNLSIDLMRRHCRKREIPVGDRFALEAMPGQAEDHGAFVTSVMQRPDEELQNRELRQKLRLALRRLSPAHRAVIVLREMEGLSYAEISKVVGCSKGTVMSRLYHARKKLQTTLSEYLPPASASMEERRMN